jgi:alpha-beta hydrolase superfamily lysophospholipase
MPVRWVLLLPLAALAASCTAHIGEDTFLHPIAGGGIDAAALAQSAPAFSMTEHWITAPDGARLSAVLLRQPDARATILYFGGNGYTIERFGAFTAALFVNAGVNLMIVDHRGYGRSEGTPSQANMEADGVAAFDYLARLDGIRADRIVAHGHSLGSFIAGRVAAERPTAGVVLESSATTAEQWVDARHRGLARALVRVEIDETLRGRGNLANMGRIDEPVLILVGAEDRTTPPSLSQALYAASPLPEGRKTLAIIPATGHNDVLLRPEARRAYADFLARIDAR